jgi:hypothetical protein
MLVGALTFSASYGLALLIVERASWHCDDYPDPSEASSCRSGGRRLMIPVVGPWLAHTKYPEQPGDPLRSPTVAIVWGSAQLFGIGTFLVGATGNAQVFTAHGRHARLNVVPVTARDWAGVGLNGSF